MLEYETSTDKASEGRLADGIGSGGVPSVSIGMPVFNGERTLLAALDSLLAQSFTDFELIISDNASTDQTESICREYAARDNRIRYVRQGTNIGAAANFKFVLAEARGEYFMWAACDDMRSPNFVEVNARFLSANPCYVASTSPNGFEGMTLDKTNVVDFSLEGDRCARLDRFFEYCWVSHGIFYSLVRTHILRHCEVVGQSFFAADWAIDLYLANRGKIHRTSEGYTVFGVRGVSRSSGAYRAFRNSLIELPLPFYRLTRYVIGLTCDLPLSSRAGIILTLGKLNLFAVLDQVHATLYSCYCAVFKPYVRRGGVDHDTDRT